MVIRWGVFYTKSRTALKTGWLITAGVIALYVGVTQPLDRARGIASEKASGLAAVSERIRKIANGIEGHGCSRATIAGLSIGYVR
jgi:hypothetical protein